MQAIGGYGRYRSAQLVELTGLVRGRDPRVTQYAHRQDMDAAARHENITGESSSTVISSWIQASMAVSLTLHHSLAVYSRSKKGRAQVSIAIFAQLEFSQGYLQFTMSNRHGQEK
uniref:Uncharacterized protein n=1 Tax=Ditylenchus dipsaci TaxID=166011 RepID=A0A915CWC2_9BILA